MRASAIAILVSLAATGAGAGAPAPAGAGLRILVVGGEDGVNIMRKTTTVQPVVEVRDRNDLPVSGASVTFLIGGDSKSAVFGNNLRQVTMTTDGSGRAAVTNLRAVGKGALRIDVQASYQGETVGATVSQTNFATVADAAKAGKAASPSGNSGSQTSNTASEGSHHIGLIAGGSAAAVGGIVAAKKFGLVGGGANCSAQNEQIWTAADVSTASWNVYSQCLAANRTPSACTAANAALQSSIQSVLNAISSFCACRGKPSDASVSAPMLAVGGGWITGCAARD